MIAYSFGVAAINASFFSSPGWPERFSMVLSDAVTWLKGVRDVAESGRSCVEMDGDSYRFVLKKANYGDGGTYIVKASNCHGSQKAYCTVRVSYRVRHDLLRPASFHPF